MSQKNTEPQEINSVDELDISVPLGISYSVSYSQVEAKQDKSTVIQQSNFVSNECIIIYAGSFFFFGGGTPYMCNRSILVIILNLSPCISFL
jgi:hypothetical protein